MFRMPKIVKVELQPEITQRVITALNATVQGSFSVEASLVHPSLLSNEPNASVGVANTLLGMEPIELSDTEVNMVKIVWPSLQNSLNSFRKVRTAV